MDGNLTFSKIASQALPSRLKVKSTSTGVWTEKVKGSYDKIGYENRWEDENPIIDDEKDELSQISEQAFKAGNNNMMRSVVSSNAERLFLREILPQKFVLTYNERNLVKKIDLAD